MNTRTIALTAAAALISASSARAQSLADQLEAPANEPVSAGVPADPSPVQRTSLIAVIPPKPKTYQKHDIIEVIINETSIEQFEQSLDTEKKYDIMAELAEFPSIKHLLELQIENGDTTSPAKLDITGKHKFEGDGDFERKDKMQARISATVIDVKPNGTLVLEARESRSSDEEVSTMVLSGVCRAEDITKTNTVQSSQLANLTIKVEHEGEVRKASKKGLIPQVLETIFNF